MEQKKIDRIKEFMVKKLKWIILFLCVVIFLAIVEDVFDQEIMRLDTWGYHFISSFLISDSVTPIAKVITNLGGVTILSVLTVILLITIRNRKIGFSIVANLAIISGLNVLLKNIVERPRPTEYRMIHETGYSFPSGHSMVSMAFYGFLIYLIYHYVKNNKLKWVLILVLSTLIVTIGISRIYLGVHYTSDVLAGFMISISYLIVYTSIVKRFIKKGDEEDDNKRQKNNQ